MKLFKKLAAAALAAVLALSMVGCGNANSVNSTKQFILNFLADSTVMSTGEYHNTSEMDGIAQKLLTEANAAYQDETQTDKTVKALMRAAAEKEGILKEGTGYEISFVEDYQFKSSLIPEVQKQLMLMQMMDTIEVNGGIALDATKLDVGVFVQLAGGREMLHGLDTLVQRRAPLQHNGAVALPGQQQGCKQARRPQAADHRAVDKRLGSVLDGKIHLLVQSDAGRGPCISRFLTLVLERDRYRVHQFGLPVARVHREFCHPQVPHFCAGDACQMQRFFKGLRLPGGEGQADVSH